jgi:hypothetical protein
MSNNKLKSKTLNNISRLEGELSGTAMGVETWSKENFETLKPKLIATLIRLSEMAAEIKEDIIEVMMLK